MRTALDKHNSIASRAWKLIPPQNHGICACHNPQPTHEYHTPILLTGTCAKKSLSHVPPKNNDHYFRFRIVFRKPLIYYTHTISTFSYLSTVQQHPGYNRFVRSTNAYTQSSYNICYPSTVVIKPIGTDWQAPLSVAFRELLPGYLSPQGWKLGRS